jgi:hypothetical protein
MEKFTIDFSYDGTSYTALVTPRLENGVTVYSVQLESENQETFVEILASPPGTDDGQWIFKCPDDQEPSEYYDKKLLEEIGEVIEQNEINRDNQELSQK